jgi:hypothetical protein
VDRSCFLLLRQVEREQCLISKAGIVTASVRHKKGPCVSKVNWLRERDVFISEFQLSQALQRFLQIHPLFFLQILRFQYSSNWFIC